MDQISCATQGASTHNLLQKRDWYGGLRIDSEEQAWMDNGIFSIIGYKPEGKFDRQKISRYWHYTWIWC
jgi:hypothetical protein